jgi:outer membrane lipoprotein SlyB
MIKITGILSAATVIALAGCTYNDGTANQPATGAVIGGVTGAAIGNAIGDDTRPPSSAARSALQSEVPSGRTWPDRNAS